MLISGLDRGYYRAVFGQPTIAKGSCWSVFHNKFIHFSRLVPRKKKQKTPLRALLVWIWGEITVLVGQLGADKPSQSLPS